MGKEFAAIEKQLREKINNIMLVARHMNFGLIFASDNPGERVFEEELYVLTYDAQLYYSISYTNGDVDLPVSQQLSADQTKHIISLLDKGLKGSRKCYNCCDGDGWKITRYNKQGRVVAHFDGYTYNIMSVQQIHRYLDFLVEENRMNRFLILQKKPCGHLSVIYGIEKATQKRVCIYQQPYDVGMTCTSEAFEALRIFSLLSPVYVKMYETFHAHGNECFVTEHVEGTSLKKIISSKPLKWRTAVDIIKEISVGVMAAHVHDYLLLSVNPTNIIVTNNGQLKILIDMKKRLFSFRTGWTGDVDLIDAYTPPELYKKEVYRSSDVYMLAATLYELIAKVPPTSSFIRYRGETLVPLSKYCPEIPVRLEKTIYKALELSTSKRTQSVSDFYSELGTI